MPHVAVNIVDFQRLSGDVLQVELTRALNFDHYSHADRASRDGGEREAEIRPAASPGMLARCADFPIGRSLTAR